MTHHLTASQLKSLETTERIASCFSLIGTTFVISTFIYSSAFRKPINRLIFFASIGNSLCNCATMISQSGIRAGKNSPLCQLQGFMIQMFLPADALWNLAMAINVYLTLFRKHNSQQLKALEWKYQVLCVGMPFIIAMVFIFIDTQPRGKIYGPAVLWCWVAPEWSALRIAFCYGPAWICIIVAFTIYILAGREIFEKRRELRAVSRPLRFSQKLENPFEAFKTTEVQVTSEIAPGLQYGGIDTTANSFAGGKAASGEDYDRYTVTIASVPAIPRPPLPTTPSGQMLLAQRNYRAALEANSAAWGYTKIAFLFFVSLLVTWVPSSINRVYSLVHPDSISIPFTYGSSVVLPLMGFWNSVIYLTTSWTACKSLFHDIALKVSCRSRGGSRGRLRGMDEQRSVVDMKRSDRSVSDSMRALSIEHRV